MPKTRIIAIVNQKGGSGKTTTSINLATGFAREYPNKRVLLIDLDPQANATAAILGMKVAVGPYNPKYPTVYEVLKEMVGPEKAIRRHSLKDDGGGSESSIDILPAHLRLAKAEPELMGEYARERKLGMAMAGLLGRYDLIVIDCPPTLGILTMNALSFATDVIVPVDPGIFPLIGLAMLEETMKIVKRADNPNLKLGGVVPTMQDRTKVANDTEDQLRKRYKNLVLPGIPRRTVIGESHAAGVDIHSFAPDSAVSEAYRRLVRQLGGEQ
jgi:chromosome partitioning protein